MVSTLDSGSRLNSRSKPWPGSLRARHYPHTVPLITLDDTEVGSDRPTSPMVCNASLAGDRCYQTAH